MSVKINGPVVEVAPGLYERKPWEQLQDTDMIAFGGGPDAFAGTGRLQRELEAEIADAGGLEAWRAQGTSQPKAA